MKAPYRLLLLTFIGSFAVISVERSIYFFTTHHMGFSEVGNLTLALGFGLTYVIGSLMSHSLAGRYGERRLLILAFLLQVPLYAMMGLFPTAICYYIAGPLSGLFAGFQWPIIESYVGAGRAAKDQQKTIGLFNLAWAIAIPMNLAVTGPLIDFLGAGMFYVPALLNLIMFWMILPVTSRPTHLADDHPHRLSPGELTHLKGLLASSRRLMLACYAAMFVLAPLLPEVFHRLDVSDTIAPALSGLLDAVRMAGFVVLLLLPGWHGRRWPIILSMLLLPTGFLASLYGPTLMVVLLGEVAFGLSMAMIYYGALYYAMAVKNAAVNAGGGHEALIGSGFAIGPAAGLLGVWLGPAIGDAQLGTLGTIGLFIVVMTLVAVPPLRKTHGPTDG